MNKRAGLGPGARHGMSAGAVRHLPASTATSARPMAVSSPLTSCAAVVGMSSRPIGTACGVRIVDCRSTSWAMR